ncbi:MAG: DUF6249 domain-containing protein [Candidatus Tyrphobacter sp.]
MDQLEYLSLLIPIVGIVVVVGLPILAWVLFRVLAHRERMEMIRHGLVPSEQYGRRARWEARGDENANFQLRRGVSVTFVGLALTIGLAFIGFHDGEFTFGPWLLGGLIPLFVGLAQVFNAKINGAGSSGARAGPHGIPSAVEPRPYETQGEGKTRPPV